MDDAVDRRARALEEERIANLRAVEAARDAKRKALAEFADVLLSEHCKKTKYPIAVEVVALNEDRSEVVYYSKSGREQITRHAVALVEAVHYGVSTVPVQIFEISRSNGERVVDGTLPHQTALNISARVVEELARAVERGVLIVAQAEAGRVEAERRDQLDASERQEWQRLENERSWDSVGHFLVRALGLFIVVAAARYLGPVVRHWFE